MENVLTLNGKAISLIRINTNSNLNGKQKALLKLLHKCLKDNTPLDWKLMVNFYVKNVDNISGRDWNSLLQKYTNGTPILPHFEKLDSNWIYYIKPKIRQWFATNMGSMILKGAILALPVIELK